MRYKTGVGAAAGVCEGALPRRAVCADVPTDIKIINKQKFNYKNKNMLNLHRQTYTSLKKRSFCGCVFGSAEERRKIENTGRSVRHCVPYAFDFLRQIPELHTNRRHSACGNKDYET